MALGMFLGQCNCMRAWFIYVNTKPLQPKSLGLIRLAGGLFTIYIKHGKRFATEKGTGIGAVVEANNDVVME